MMNLTILYRDIIILNITLEMTQMMGTVELAFSNMSYFRRDDFSIFIPHVIETLFIEVKLNETNSIVLGVI